MRRGIDRLASIVTQQFGGKLREDSLFLFCGRRTDRIKALYYSGDGYVPLYKRLNNGAFQWLRTAAELTAGCVQVPVADGRARNRAAEGNTKGPGE